MVIYHVWVFTKKSGISLYHKKYGSVEVDESLFSGFLSSINTLAESEFDQKGIESIKMGDYKFLYDHFCGVLFTVAVDPEDSESEIREMLYKARIKFFNQFAEEPWENYLKELAKSGQVEHFNNYQNTLDEVVFEYKQEKAEETNNKKRLIDFYKLLINKFFLKVLAFSEVLDEDFQTPLSNVVNDLVKNNAILKEIKISEDGLSFEAVDANKIEIIELRTFLHEILDGLTTTCYNLMGTKPVNKIIVQLGSMLSKKLTDIQNLEICHQVLQILLKSEGL
ncbi:MAG: hypothetical protein HWN67_05655 [Candidatus Helarchaeota archaeon]|nr:hypothetical protein [Candidatus Helarchaeota archaeon]